MDNKDEKITTALIAKDIEYIKKEVNKISDKLQKNYVTQTEFRPVKNLVYGLVGTVLLAVVGSLVGLVVIK